MVGGTSFPPQDSKSEPWSNEQKTKATPKPKPEARTLAGSGIATGSLEVSLDNADTVIKGAPSLRGFLRKGGIPQSPPSRDFLEPHDRKSLYEKSLPIF